MVRLQRGRNGITPSCTGTALNVRTSPDQKILHGDKIPGVQNKPRRRPRVAGCEGQPSVTSTVWLALKCNQAAKQQFGMQDQHCLFLSFIFRWQEVSCLNKMADL